MEQEEDRSQRDYPFLQVKVSQPCPPPVFVKMSTDRGEKIPLDILVDRLSVLQVLQVN